MFEQHNLTCLLFELNQFGFGVKTISPDGIDSSFRGSVERVENEAYDGLFDQVMHAFMSGKTPTLVSSAEQIAEVVYEAATDSKDQLYN